MKQIKILTFCALCALCGLTTQAGFQVNSGPVLLTVATNSGLVVNQPNYVTLPSTTVIISGITNPATQVTNSFCQTLTANGTTFTVSTNFVFNAAAQGLTNASPGNPLSWTNTFSSQQLTVPNWSFLQAAPQSGGSNTCSISAN